VHSLPIFIRLQGRPVILVGNDGPAEPKRRLLERAGAVVVSEDADAQLAVVALDDPDATVARLKARGILVNAVDRPDLCDFTLPAIVDRDPVLIAIGTGGASAGLAAALRQRLEALLPPKLGAVARLLQDARDVLRRRFADAGERRRAIASALAPGGPLDLFNPDLSATEWMDAAPLRSELVFMELRSEDPDDLTLRQARLLAQADRVFHRTDVPAAILDRARADAARIACDAPPAELAPGLSLDLAMAPR
jgi:uroporphyrin-III C-methyltransferase / precorrin-2 dehydrogenase / sirohydrochlorin ferrochelatase